MSAAPAETRSPTRVIAANPSAPRAARPGRAYSPTLANHICGFCRGPLLPGEIHLLLDDVADTFASHNLMARGEPHICEACIPTLESPWLTRYASAVHTTEGSFSFSKSNDIAWHVLNPPKVPYTLNQKTAKSAHVVWSSRVSLPGDVAWFNLGGTNHLIRYPLLRRAWEASAAHRHAAETARKDARASERGRLPPATYLLTGSFDGLHAYDLTAHASPADAEIVNHLTPGETWLLLRIQSQNPSTLQSPTRFF